MKLSFVCTGQDRHPLTLLGSLSTHPGGGLIANDEIHGWQAERAAESLWLDHLDEVLLWPENPVYRVNIRCPRCRSERNQPRHVQWTHAKALDVMKKLRDSELKRVDISKLPAQYQ